MFWPATKEDRRNFLTRFDEMDNLFGNLADGIGTAFGDYQYFDDAGNLIKEIECPGFNKDNLNVEVSEGILIINGERKDHDGVERKLYKRYRMGTYENVEAEIKDGILYLKILTPKEKKQKINIK